MALQKFDDLWFRIALSEQAESRGTASRRKPETPVPIRLFQHCGYYHLALASINIYNEKYEIYKTESNLQGRRYSKK